MKPLNHSPLSCPLLSRLSFKFDKRQLASLDFSYDKGRDPNTLKQDQTWKISVGIKY